MPLTKTRGSMTLIKGITVSIRLETETTPASNLADTGVGGGRGNTTNKRKETAKYC